MIDITLHVWLDKDYRLPGVEWALIKYTDSIKMVLFITGAYINTPKVKFELYLHVKTPLAHQRQCKCTDLSIDK